MIFVEHTFQSFILVSVWYWCPVHTGLITSHWKYINYILTPFKGFKTSYDGEYKTIFKILDRNLNSMKMVLVGIWRIRSVLFLQPLPLCFKSAILSSFYHGHKFPSLIVWLWLEFWINNSQEMDDVNTVEAAEAGEVWT